MFDITFTIFSDSQMVETSECRYSELRFHSIILNWLGCDVIWKDIIISQRKLKFNLPMQISQTQSSNDFSPPVILKTSVSRISKSSDLITLRFQIKSLEFMKRSRATCVIRFFVLEYGRIKSWDLRLKMNVFIELFFLCFMPVGNPAKIPATTGSVFMAHIRICSFCIFEL